MRALKHLKGIFLATAIVVMTLLFSFALVACGETEANNDNPNDTHTHELTHHAKVDATCTTAGTKEYWSCAGCGKNFSDAQGKTEVSDLTLPAGHKLTKHDEVKSTCKVAGNPTYWSCEVCKKNFSDAEGKTETTEITSPLAAHTLSKVEAVAQTCVTDGNTEHYHCSVCNKDFEDEEGTTEAANVVIAADGTSHKYEDNGNDGYVKSADATCYANAKEKRTCLVEGCEHEEEREIEGSKLPHNYDENGVCQNEGCTDTNGPRKRVGKAPVKVNDTEVEFGTYPQTEVNDSSVTTKLEELAGEWSADNDKWTAYDYWNGEDGETLMYYSDVFYNDVYYRGVYINWSRPGYPGSTLSEQTENGYMAQSTYWFEFEPIRWSILEETDGKAFILAKDILDSQPFQADKNFKGPNGDLYINNYAHSTIRTFLNEDFLNWAFSELEQTYIEITDVDNSSSAGYNSSKWACENTQDKIFLLSEHEAKNYELGSRSEESAKRRKAGTSYAMAQGLQYDDGSQQLVPEGYSWWLRTPTSDSSNQMADRIAGDGWLGPYYFGQQGYESNAYFSKYGVVPAMNIHFEA